MTSNRFFIEEKPDDATHFYLIGKEHHHLSRVTRAKQGDLVWLFDRNGNQYRACVEEIKKDKTRLLILETKIKRRSKIRITLAQVILKAKKMDLVIRKATELGTHSIHPIISDRTVVKIENRQDKKMERWKRITVEAAKQCGRSALPKIHSPTGLNSFITREDKAKKLFLSERGSKYLRDILISPFMAETKIPTSVILLIGSEGGWTEKEEQDIMENCFEAVSVGSLTLRSETAAIVSLAMVSHFWMNDDVS